MQPADPPRTFAAVADLAELATQAALTADCPLRALSVALNATMQSDVDPYVLLGVLVEAIVQTMAGNIPPERHAGAVMATALLLRERFRDCGIGAGTARNGTAPRT